MRVYAAAASVCVSLYNQRLWFYFNTLQRRAVTLRAAAPEGHVTVLLGFNRDEITESVCSCV